MRLTIITLSTIMVLVVLFFGVAATDHLWNKTWVEEANNVWVKDLSNDSGHDLIKVDCTEEKCQEVSIHLCKSQTSWETKVSIRGQEEIDIYPCKGGIYSVEKNLKWKRLFLDAPEGQKWDRSPLVTFQNRDKRL